jgi:hypothetical protein
MNYENTNCQHDTAYPLHACFLVRLFGSIKWQERGKSHKERAEIRMVRFSGDTDAEEDATKRANGTTEPCCINSYIR